MGVICISVKHEDVLTCKIRAGLNLTSAHAHLSKVIVLSKICMYSPNS